MEEKNVISRSRLSSVHTSRTLMVSDLKTVLSQLDRKAVSVQSLKKSVIEDNILSKQTERTRVSSWRHLNSTYHLEGKDLADSGFLSLWQQVNEAHEQLALLRGLPNDRLLQISTEKIRSLAPGHSISWPELAEFLQGRGLQYSEKTLRSAAQNLLSSWLQVGWLSGNNPKQRATFTWHPAAITYLLYQEYRQGKRGLGLYDSEIANLLGLTPEQLDTLASKASKRGYLNYRRIDDVLEITFPAMLRRTI